MNSEAIPDRTDVLLPHQFNPPTKGQAFLKIIEIDYQTGRSPDTKMIIIQIPSSQWRSDTCTLVKQ